ncbi:MAG: carboxy terminal-processing peptidase, partial [Bacteroidetes bacterium]|nr:carboxy terminal-processing peptidase [Bacteroidota bacterium]
KQTHQGIGIVPDIAIPDMSQVFAEKEQDEPYYLKPDSVVKNVIYSPLKLLPIDLLAAASQKRIKANQQFVAINHLSDSIRSAETKDRKILLNLKPMKLYTQTKNQLNNRIQGLFELTHYPSFEVSNNIYNNQLTTFNEYQKQINDQEKQRLAKDLILFESFLIMKDYLNMQP